jgi:hypothetical protein
MRDSVPGTSERCWELPAYDPAPGHSALYLALALAAAAAASASPAASPASPASPASSTTRFPL